MLNLFEYVFHVHNWTPIYRAAEESFRGRTCTKYIVQYKYCKECGAMTDTNMNPEDEHKKSIILEDVKNIDGKLVLPDVPFKIPRFE